MQPRLLLMAAIATCASLLNACDDDAATPAENQPHRAYLSKMLVHRR